MTDFTAGQKTVTRAPTRRSKILVKLDLPTPVGFCIGQDPKIVSGLRHDQRAMRAPAMPTTDLNSAGWELDFFDGDRTFYDDWVDNESDWQNFEVTVRFYEARSIDPDWTLIETRVWTVSSVQQDDMTRWMHLEFSGSVGMNPRSAETEGSRETDPLAPDPTKPIVMADGERSLFVGSGPRTPPPPPGGDEGLRVLPPWMRVLPNLPVSDAPVNIMADPSLTALAAETESAD